MAIPPRVGTSPECEALPFGDTHKPLAFETFTIGGTETKLIINAVKKLIAIITQGSKLNIGDKLNISMDILKILQKLVKNSIINHNSY